jgi:hypothetical protein
VLDAGPLGRAYVDLLLAWIAVLLHVAAWPRLWWGLRDLRARRPGDPNAILAGRACVLSIGFVVAAVVVLPLEYLTFGASEAWLPILLVSAFPYLPWTFIPVLALHGILFGRVATALVPACRRLADGGAAVLFAVSGATTAVVLGHPGATAYVDSWSVGLGLLPGAAFLGYLLIAVALALHVAPARGPVAVRSPGGAP